MIYGIALILLFYVLYQWIKINSLELDLEHSINEMVDLEHHYKTRIAEKNRVIKHLMQELSDKSSES